MARKTATVIIDGKGRDKGKVFLLTEMSADATEQWAIQAFLALLNTGVELPDGMGMDNMSMEVIARLGLKALGGLPFDAAKPLLDQMWECVQIIPDPKKPNVMRHLIPEDIEEASTKFQLRKEIFSLHTDFFTAGAE